MPKRIIAAVTGLFLLVLIGGCQPGSAPSQTGASTGGQSSLTTSATETEGTTADTTAGVGEQTAPPSNTTTTTTQKQGTTDATKVLGPNAGAEFYIVELLDDHPGVVDMDARYIIRARDKAGNYLPTGDMVVSTNNPNVAVSGSVLTVPYAVRASSKPLIVTVKNKNKPERTGTYTFNFLKFSAEPTLFDDFDTLDTDLWTDKYFEDHLGGYVEDSNLIFTAEDASRSFSRSTFGSFSQAYGCFSARIDMPDRGLVNAAFWLCTEPGVIYIKNKQRPVQSGGELDIVEYFPTWGDRWAATIHWNGWSSYHRAVGKDTLAGPNIRDGYHIFSAVWTPHAIYWYYDGELSYTYTGEGVAPNSGPMQVLLQLGVKDSDCDWGGAYDPDAFPTTMKIDWVKVHALVS